MRNDCLPHVKGVLEDLRDTVRRRESGALVGSIENVSWPLVQRPSGEPKVWI